MGESARYEARIDVEAVALLKRALGAKDERARGDAAIRLLLDLQETVTAAGLTADVTPGHGAVSVWRGRTRLDMVSADEEGVRISFDGGKSGRTLPLEYRHDEGASGEWVGAEDEPHTPIGARPQRKRVVTVIAEAIAATLTR